MQSYNKLFIKQLFFNTENGDEVRKKTALIIESKKDASYLYYFNWFIMYSGIVNGELRRAIPECQL
jgi:hypothetical protein